MENNKKSSETTPLKTDSTGRFFEDIQIEFLVHELKGPIAIMETGIRTLLDKQHKYGQLAPRQEKIIKRVLKNAQKARTMLYDLLETGRSEAGCIRCRGFQPAKATYETLINALEIMASDIFYQVIDYPVREERLHFLSSCGISLEIDPLVSEAEMFQDEVKFRQVAGNLIKNALHHRNQHLEIKVRLEDDHLIVAVRDDGPGVKPDDQEAIFHRYTQVSASPDINRQGHGLGLAGALITARSLGGNITIESDVEKGATFRLNLPMTFKETPE